MFQIITVNREQAATINIIINITFLLFVHFQSTSLNLAIYFIVSLLARFKKKLGKGYATLYLRTSENGIER